MSGRGGERGVGMAIQRARNGARAGAQQFNHVRPLFPGRSRQRARAFTRGSLFVHLRRTALGCRGSLGVRNARTRSPPRGRARGSDRYTINEGFCTCALVQTCVPELMPAHTNQLSRGLFQPSWGSVFGLASACRAPMQARCFAYRS